MVVLGGCVTLFMPGLALGVTAAIAEAVMPPLHTASGLVYSMAGYISGTGQCVPQKDSQATDPVDSRWDKVYIPTNTIVASTGTSRCTCENRTIIGGGYLIGRGMYRSWSIWIPYLSMLLITSALQILG